MVSVSITGFLPSGSMDELGNLMCRQLIGVDTEVESVDWQIEHGMVFLRQDMLHLADGSSIHELVVSRLVVPGGTDARNQERQTEDTEGGWHGSRHTGNGHQPFLERSQFEYGDEEDVNLDELLAEEGDELLEQFRREAKSAARLVHPYIINIYDVVSEGSNQYIVMEYVDGVTLKEYMQEHKLSLNTVL